MKLRTILTKLSLLTILCFGIAMDASSALPQQASGRSLPSLAPMLEKVNPAVVNVLATGKPSVTNEENFLDPGNPQQMPKMPPRKRMNKDFQSVGSGVIVDAKQGYILTNSHLIEQAKSVTITLSDGRHFKAKLIGVDPASDIAVVKINATNLTQIKMGDSSNLKVGDFVVAIGNPYGLNQTVTSGIVSALERAGLGIEGYEDFIQTDASINPGNSGGALVNLNGELVGINTAILAPNGGNVGIGFAIPSNMAFGIMQQLVKHGNVGRGIVGVMVQSVTPELAKALGQPKQKGAVITSVSPNSPAAKAGLRTGDIVQDINGKNIETASQVKNTIGLMRAGSKFKIKVLRNNKPTNVELISAEPEAYKKFTHAHNPFLYGVVLKNFDAEIPNFDRVQGVQAMQISENSPSYQAGLRPGDVLLSVNGRNIDNLSELLSLADNNQNELLVNVFRNNGTAYIVINK